MPSSLSKTSVKSMNPLPDNHTIDTEFIILENIYNSSMQQPLRQRDLAQIAGASLGMTNSILKKLAQKGWITVKKLNSRNIQYAVTLEGINEIIHRSYRYFKRTIRNTVYFKDILDEAVFEASRKNITKVALVGKSDLDFIVEHACRHWGLHFSKISDDSIKEISNNETLIIFSEGISGERKAAQPNVFYLSRLIIKQAATAAGSSDN